MPSVTRPNRPPTTTNRRASVDDPLVDPSDAAGRTVSTRSRTALLASAAGAG